MYTLNDQRMKAAVNIARILVGALFIFSGLVKAIDPLGLSYKMQEFFEVWANDGFMKGMMMWLYGHALLFSVLMIALEVILGFTLLIGWKKNITSWLLLLLTLFFTFLTAFVLFTGKIRACGCFGDCIPLTPIQTFTKDIILTLLIILIIIGRKYIQPLFKKAAVSLSLMLLCVLCVSFLQYYVLHHLPLKDCLPFQVGNNILELRKMPKDAVQDKYDYVFVYSKNGEKKEFKMNAIPDSSWTFVDRKQILIKKGKNNIPLINDFTLTTGNGVDTTEAILSQPKEYYLLFVKDPGEYPNVDKFLKLIINVSTNNTPLYIVTSNRELAMKKMWGHFDVVGGSYDPLILTCDATAIKTAARNNITLYKMNGPVVQGKWGGSDIDKAIQ
jgi:uncharacterized membrane protein YphA (DoxX/SURF4 family)